MEIIITKDTKDPREGRGKMIPKDKKITCSAEFGQMMIDKKVAKPTEPDLVKIETKNDKTKE